MAPQLRFVNLQRPNRRRCIVSHGGGLSWSGSLVLGSSIEPDRGHRLEMCERNVTSSRQFDSLWLQFSISRRTVATTQLSYPALEPDDEKDAKFSSRLQLDNEL